MGSNYETCMLIWNYQRNMISWLSVQIEKYSYNAKIFSLVQVFSRTSSNFILQELRKGKGKKKYFVFLTRTKFFNIIQHILEHLLMSILPIQSTESSRDLLPVLLPLRWTPPHTPQYFASARHTFQFDFVNIHRAQVCIVFTWGFSTIFGLEWRNSYAFAMLTSSGL